MGIFSIDFIVMKIGKPIKFVATYHPAYLLRNPQKTPGSPKALTWDDIRAVRAKFDALTGGE